MRYHCWCCPQNTTATDLPGPINSCGYMWSFCRLWGCLLLGGVLYLEVVFAWKSGTKKIFFWCAVHAYKTPLAAEDTATNPQSPTNQQLGFNEMCYLVCFLWPSTRSLKTGHTWFSWSRRIMRLLNMSRRTTSFSWLFQSTTVTDVG